MLTFKTKSRDLNAWIKDQGSCLVGVDTMKRYNLEVGEKMLLSGTFYPVDLDMEIVGTYEGTLDDRNVFFHHKYLDELTDDPGTVGTWWVRAGSAEVAPKVVSTINETFANTSAEVRAESERAFQSSAIVEMVKAEPRKPYSESQCAKTHPRLQAEWSIRARSPEA